jgi:1L-myo-inositol 1-phosphate cytidylyltransferase
MKRSQRIERTGLILAAGYGSRHAEGDKTVLKPLLDVGGRALILRAIDSLRTAGCSRVVVVLGHEAEQIQSFVQESYSGDAAVDFVINPRFDLKNGVSVLAASELLTEEFVLAMADHVFEPSVMALVAAASSPQDGATLIVDSKVDSILDIDDATKVLVRDGRIERIGKDLEDFNAVDCGVFVAGPALLRALDGILRAKGDASVSEGVQELANRGRMEALDLGDARWQDVDTAEMISAAEGLLSGR